MSEIAIYQQIADPVTAISTLGASIAKSRMFGCENEAQGEVLAMECLARGLAPLSLASQYDIIQGKLSMRADAMLAGFESAGGKYEIKEYSADACEIVFSRGATTLAIRITWEDAQGESWPWTPKKQLKTNWSTPIGRQDMLWARVVSRGVRRLAPGVVCGRYTPEEISDIEPAPVKPPDAAVGVAAQHAAAVAASNADSDAIDAEFTTAEQPAAPAAPSETKQLMTEPSTGSDSGQSMPVDGLCTPEQDQKIKAAIKAAMQSGAPDMTDKVRAALHSCGAERIRELTYANAQRLLGAIETRNIAAFMSGEATETDENIPF